MGGGVATKASAATLTLILVVASLVVFAGYDHYTLSNSVATLAESNSRLESQFSVLNSSNLQAQSQLGAMTSELTSLADNNSRLTSQVSSYSTQITSLSNQNVQLQSQVESLNKTILLLNANVVALNSSNAHITAQVASLNNQVASLQNLISNLNSQIVQLQQQIVTLRTQLATIDPAFDIVQHVFVVPTNRANIVTVHLALPVVAGDLLVVGAVFGKNVSGSCEPNGCPFSVAARINASASDSLSGPLSTRDAAIPQSQFGSVYITDMSNVIWWGTARSSGNDTISVKGPATELVEVFEVANADLSTVGVSAQWGHRSLSNGATYVEDIGGVGNTMTRPFVLVIGSTDANMTTNCVSGPPQSQGFSFEPYCGTDSPFTNEQIYGEFAATNTGSFFASLGTGPLFTPYSLVGDTFFVSLR